MRLVVPKVCRESGRLYAPHCPSLSYLGVCIPSMPPYVYISVYPACLPMCTPLYTRHASLYAPCGIPGMPPYMHPRGIPSMPPYVHPAVCTQHASLRAPCCMYPGMPPFCLSDLMKGRGLSLF